MLTRGVVARSIQCLRALFAGHARCSPARTDLRPRRLHVRAWASATARAAGFGGRTATRRAWGVRRSRRPRRHGHDRDGRDRTEQRRDAHRRPHGGRQRHVGFAIGAGAETLPSAAHRARRSSDARAMRSSRRYSIGARSSATRRVVASGSAGWPSQVGGERVGGLVVAEVDADGEGGARRDDDLATAVGVDVGGDERVAVCRWPMGGPAHVPLRGEGSAPRFDGTRHSGCQTSLRLAEVVTEASAEFRVGGRRWRVPTAPALRGRRSAGRRPPRPLRRPRPRGRAAPSRTDSSRRRTTRSGRRTRTRS